MSSIILLPVLSACVFCAMILNLAAKPKFTKNLTGIFTVIAGVGSLVFYGAGFASVLENPLLVILRTVFAVSRMYVGVNDFSSISAAPILSSQLSITLFWVFHVMGFYAMASATISTIGASALKALKFWLQRYGKSIIIYGINSNSVELARDLISNGAKNIVFVGAKPDASCEAAAASAGCLVRSDLSALKPDRKFLASLGSEKGAPDLTLYALDSDFQSNMSYASALLSALRGENVCTDNIRLVIQSSDDSVDCPLAAAEGRYGYGSVMNFTDVSVAGRMLVTEMPPHSKLSFSNDGTADGDFDAVIVGFGKTGRSVLRNLVRTAQFDGSHFRAAVFAKNIESENGYFFSSYPGLVGNYDISFQSCDAKSLSFFSYLREHSPSLRYVVICTGSPTADSEIRGEIESYLASLGCDAAICICSGKSISWSEAPNTPVNYRSVYSYKNMCADNMDTLASVLNYSYVNSNETTKEEAWRGCDYFSRESSRASADFLPAFLHISGLTEESTADDWKNLPPALQESMAKTEHLRWCAFHYSMGFEGMSDETVRSRGEKYRELKAKGEEPLRICKDLQGRRHACLRSWDELDALSELEAEYTGAYTDYKDMDLRNVLSVPEIIAAGREDKK